eukprot:172872-Prorocentrum_minimum.AAC.3
MWASRGGNAGVEGGDGRRWHTKVGGELNFSVGKSEMALRVSEGKHAQRGGVGRHGNLPQPNDMPSNSFVCLNKLINDYQSVARETKGIPVDYTNYRQNFVFCEGNPRVQLLAPPATNYVFMITIRRLWLGCWQVKHDRTVTCPSREYHYETVHGAPVGQTIMPIVEGVLPTPPGAVHSTQYRCKRCTLSKRAQYACDIPPRPDFKARSSVCIQK